MASTKHSNLNVFLSKTAKIILCIILAFLLFCLFSVAVYYFSTSDIHTFAITPERCVDLTGSYPDDLNDAYVEFFKSWNIEYEIIDGNLVLYVNERTLESIIEIYIQSADYAIEKGVAISSDYKRIEFDANKPIEKDGFTSPWSVLECAWIQLYSGVPIEDIAVEVVAIDYSTNEIVYQATWPNYITYTYITDEVKITYFIEDGVSYYREVPVK